MNDREMALHEMRRVAASAVSRLEEVKGWLVDLTPEEAQLWFKARQACDFLYEVGGVVHEQYVPRPGRPSGRSMSEILADIPGERYPPVEGDAAKGGSGE